MIRFLLCNTVYNSNSLFLIDHLKPSFKEYNKKIDPAFFSPRLN